MGASYWLAKARRRLLSHLFRMSYFFFPSASNCALACFESLYLPRPTLSNLLVVLRVELRACRGFSARVFIRPLTALNSSSRVM